MDYFRRARRLDNVVLICLGVLLLAAAALALAGSLATQPSVPSDACGTRSLPSAITAALRTRTRFIALVGDGVPGQTLVVERPYSTQFAQGYDLYQGVQHALRTPALKSLLDKVGVVFIDDGGNPRCAAEIADILRQRPELIGVVGHSTTACTIAALPSYKKANIPVLIPAATNPALLAGHERHAFRLPSNDDVQALVIADMVVKQLKARSVFIIWDATAEAEQYSEYIKNQVQHLLTDASELGVTRDQMPIIEGSYPISLNPLNYSYLFRRIVSSDADIVIFAGYGSLAREFLLGLSHEYSIHPQRPKPRIILTDGCKIPGLQPYDFKTYITFAAKPLKAFPVFETFDAGTPIAGFQKMYLLESFEVFGHDAAMILLSAINEADTDGAVSRQHVIETIAKGVRSYPTAYQYEFSNGENVRSRYYCYAVSDDTIAYAYEDEALAPLLRNPHKQR